MIFAVAIIAIVLVILSRCIMVVPQARAYVIERLGVFTTVWNEGVHMKVPLIERVAKKVNMKEQVIDFEPQSVITKDNVKIMIDTVVFYQITDPEKFAYGVEKPLNAIENLTATTLRNIIGELKLDETLTSRETVNSKMRESLDIATDPWGIKVNRVELKNIIPPAEIQEAMEKEMKAEREKRAMILVAEGEKTSKILEAEAASEAIIKRAEAEKQKKIKEAEGQALAIREVQLANAEGIRYLKEAGADQSVLTLKSFEALTQVANGQATKIIIPSELQNIAGSLKAAAEVVKEGK